jgi:hypothetical protein
LSAPRIPLYEPFEVATGEALASPTTYDVASSHAFSEETFRLDAVDRICDEMGGGFDTIEALHKACALTKCAVRWVQTLDVAEFRGIAAANVARKFGAVA